MLAGRSNRGAGSSDGNGPSSSQHRIQTPHHLRYPDAFLRFGARFGICLLAQRGIRIRSMDDVSPGRDGYLSIIIACGSNRPWPSSSRSSVDMDFVSA